MKKWVAAAALLSSLGFWTNAQAESEVSTYIVNGTTADTINYPSFVSFFYDSFDFNGSYGETSFCGATMLDSNHVLTAAHCLYDDNGSLNYQIMLFATVGQTDDELNYAIFGTTVRAAEFFIHPGFQDTVSSLWANDVAIIRLETSLQTHGTVTRPVDEGYRLGSNNVDNDINDNVFQIVGHGNLRSTGDSSADDNYQLQSAQVSYVSNATCNDDLSLVTNKQICFKGISATPDTNLTSGTCQGDSGGPVYWNDSGNLVQVGITSFGPATCGQGFTDSEVTSVFTEIYDYRDWITSVLDDDIDATFVATDEKRRDFVNGTFDPETPSGIVVPSSGGGGGSLGPWLLAMLAGIALWRGRESLGA